MENTQGVINIRIATILDLNTIQELNRELCLKENKEYDSSINPDYPITEAGHEYFKSRIGNPDSLALIAEEEGFIVGYFIGSLVEPEDYRILNKLAEGENMCVRDSFRGRGVGSKFTSKFEEWCREKGVEVIRYVASAGNTKAIQFYKSQGLKEVNITLEKRLMPE